MKKLSKRMLSILLAALLVVTALPLTVIPAFSDDSEYAALDAALMRFENEYVVPLSTGDYSKLKTNMGKAYSVYLEAVAALDTETLTDDPIYKEKLLAVMDDSTNEAYMGDFVEAAANADVKIGTSETQQPKASYTNEYNEADSDYNSVIYSDGETATDWSQASSVVGGGTYGITSASFRRVFTVYYPNAVLLYNGNNAPAVPVIVGVRNNGYSTTEVIFENFYENTADVELKKDWYGTNDGRYNDSTQHRYSVPTWPYPLQMDSDDILMKVSRTMGSYPNPFSQSNGTYYATNNDSTYQLYRNSIYYTPQNVANQGLSVLDSIAWLGAVGFSYGHALGVAETNGYRFIKRLDSDKTKLMIINYNLLTDAIKSCLATNKDYFTAENARKGTLGTIFNALQRATDFDPNSFDYAGENYTEANYRYDEDENLLSAIEAAAEECGDELDNAVADLEAASNEDLEDEYHLLEAQMESYVTKMAQQKVYTNMSEAYALYCTAVQYGDAFIYGGERDFTPRLGRLAYDLQVAIENMKPVGSEDSYTAYSSQAFEGDDDTAEKSGAYMQAYKNLVYADNGPERDHSPNNHDTGSDRVLRLNNETYANTYLYIPYAVAVYDGTNFTDANPARIPAIVGFLSENDGWRLPQRKDRWLLYYTSTTDALQFEHNWKTRTYEEGDEDLYIDSSSGEGEKFVFDVNTTVGNGLYEGIKNGTITGMTKTYIESASLNELLNTETIEEAKDAFSSKNGVTTMASNWRSNHTYNSPDPENYYANTIRIALPTFGVDNTVSYSEKEWTKYYYKYTTIATRMGTYGGNGVTIGTRPTSTNNTATGSINTLGIYVINYKPVMDLVNANDDLLTAAPLDVTAYKEGGLAVYFSDMDKLTSCSPNNTKYKYYSKNAKVYDVLAEYGSTKTGYAAVVENCAYDIWKLLDSDTDEAVQVLDVDGDYINNVVPTLIDNKTVEADEGDELTGLYGDLKTALQLNPDEDEEIGPCIDEAYWNRFESAVEAGKKAMANIAYTEDEGKTHRGYVNNFAYDYSYNTSDTTQDISHNASNAENDFPNYSDSIATYTKEIKASYEALRGKEATRHQYGIIEGTLDYKNKTADFECKPAVALHSATPQKLSDEKFAQHPDVDNVEMDVYLVLEMSYNLLDPDKYDNARRIREAKTEFDKVIDPESTGVPAETPYEIVDEGITKLLTQITIANETSIEDADDDLNMEGKRIARNSIKFIVKNTETGDETDLTNTIVDTSSSSVVVDNEGNIKVPYGYEFKADASSVVGDLTCTGWSVAKNNEAEKKLDITTNVIDYYVQEDTVITAYYTPAASSEQKQVKISSVHGNPLYKVNAAKGAVISVAADDLNTVYIAGKAYTVPDGLQQQVTGWIYNGKKYLPEDLAEGATDLLNITVGDGDIDIKPYAPVVPVNGPYTIKLDDVPISEETYAYDDIVTVTSNAENVYAIAVNVDGVYIPVAYGNTYKFYANSGMTNFYSLCRTSEKSDKSSDVDVYTYTVKGVDVTDSYSNEQYFIMEGNMPMAYSIAEQTSAEPAKFTTRTQYTLNTGHTMFNPDEIKITEVGTLYYVDRENTFDINADASKLVLDNVGSSAFSVSKKISSVLEFSKKDNFSNQYSYTLANNKNRRVYTRAYVKYEYTFDNRKSGEDHQSATISAVYYGNICKAFDETKPVQE